ncbi:MAG: sigma-54-dependent Fis family transcriptional regulator [Deltaproteobacteria bacterium]|nr:sigma-54-dependent Fis family transcriptional regulator [Deltaproteobacteria bacterium]
MKARDLDLRELLSLEPEGGIVRFGGQRAIIMDAVALGLLRKELIESLGVPAARGVLTRFGYAHGWRTAESLRTAFPWDDEKEWRLGGARLHMLQGIVLLDPDDLDGTRDPLKKLWRDSYEAEQHLLHFGQAEEPVCWALAGFASGYVSCCEGREFYCVEDRCRGRGDPECRLLGQSKEEWGESIEPYLAFYRKESMDTTLTELTEALRRTEEQLKARRAEIARLTGAPQDPSGLVARSRAMARVLELAHRIAKVESAVLVTGESGVGKERIARLIHEESSRAGRPFVAVNCGAISETLLESELFGHAKGSFTGAVRARRGMYEEAAGGTLFLDEVGDLPLTTQVKLLRVVESDEVTSLGSDRVHRAEARYIAATHRDLEAMVERGEFRRDLYQRLAGVVIRLPPLRAHPEDIPEIGMHFAARYLRGPEWADRSHDLRRWLEGQVDRPRPWSGNVRELENVIRNLLLGIEPWAAGPPAPAATAARIDTPVLPPAIADGTAPLAVVRDWYVSRVLERASGNFAAAARTLRVDRTTARRLVRRRARRDPD